MYTSGTTGLPKGMMRSHASILGNHRDRERRLQSTDRDVFINYLPLFHIFGYVDGPLGSMFTGYRQVLLESFNADETLDVVERERGAWSIRRPAAISRSACRASSSPGRRS